MFKHNLKIIIAIILSLFVSGCAVYYRDAESGAEHIWGFGHLAMKATPPLEGKQALIKKATLTGIAVGIEDGSFGFSVGMDQRERIIIYDENAAICIQRPPSNDFFYFKIGTYPITAPHNNTLESEEDQP